MKTKQKKKQQNTNQNHFRKDGSWRRDVTGNSRHAPFTLIPRCLVGVVVPEWATPPRARGDWVFFLIWFVLGSGVWLSEPWGAENFNYVKKFYVIPTIYILQYVFFKGFFQWLYVNKTNGSSSFRILKSITRKQVVVWLHWLGTNSSERYKLILKASLLYLPSSLPKEKKKKTAF